MIRILAILALLFATPAWAAQAEVNFQALRFLGEVALGLLGFSAILIGLSRVDDGALIRPTNSALSFFCTPGLGLYLGLFCRSLFLTQPLQSHLGNRYC